MSLAGVVFVPHPPLLLCENAGAQDVAGGLRSACVAVLRQALGEGMATTDEAAGPTTGPAAGRVRVVLVTGRGRSAGRFTGAPLGVRVGEQLLAAAGAADLAAVATVVVGAAGADAIAADVADAEVIEAEVVDAGDRVRALCGAPEPVVLVLLADGSARRDEVSPGLPDERARAFDECFLAAVREGDVAALAGLEAGGLDAELLIDGRPALQAAGRAIAGLSVRVTPVSAALHDDLGVAYVVGRWRCESC